MREGHYSRYITVFILLFLQSTKSQVEPDCKLPSGKPGLCTPLSDCNHIVDLIGNLQKPLPRDVSLLLRESFFCDKGPGIQVCCPPGGSAARLIEQQDTPINCGFQEGGAGKCVPYDICSPFVQLMANLRKPLPNTTPKLVRSSFLCGVAESLPKVCCPSAALSDRPKPPRSTTEKTATTTERFSDHPGRSSLESKDFCGINTPNTRIVGGQNASIGQYPWLVNLGYRQNNRPRNLFKCGGTLIGSKYVLTAAHCVIQLPRGFELSVVRLGEFDLSQDIDCQGGEQGFCAPPAQDFQIESVLPHESYGKPASFQNDIAIIKLAGEASISDTVAPICLPYNGEQDDYIATRMNVDGEDFEIETAVAGWGATNKVGRDPAEVLQFLKVNVTDSAACKDIYSTRGGVLTEKQICAGGEKGKDSCVGDSGSGLMRTYPDPITSILRYQLIGVVSFGPRLCGTEGVPGVYTRVNSYIPWILDTVANN